MKKEEANKNDNSFGVCSVVFGIFSILSTFLPMGVFYGVILGVLGLIFARKQNNFSQNNWSKKGKSLSIVGLVLSLIFLIFFLWLGNNPEILSQLQQYGSY